MNKRSNSIPEKTGPLTEFTNEVISGVKLHGGTLELTKTTAATLAKELKAAQTADKIYSDLKSAPALTLNPALRVADRNAKSFLVKTKNLLRVHIGHHWNERWAEAGYANASLATPNTVPEREAVLHTLSTYFAAHPGQESVDPEVSAELAAKLHQALQSARLAIETHRERQKAALVARDKAVAALRKSLRITLAELDRELDRDSPLWGAFGLTAPVFMARGRRIKAGANPTTGPNGDTARTATPNAGSSDGQKAALVG